MNGYLAPFAPDPGTRLAYRSAQCALCHHLGEEYGTIYRLLAGPDMVFLALLREVAAGAEATLHRRACVVAPLVTRLPVRADSPAIRYAAAAGVYLAVEKLRDDWEDERSWLKGLAWRALRPGQVRARQVLADAGLDLAAVDAELRAQAAIERGTEADLEVAAAPTRRLAAAFFSGGAGPAAGALAAIGAHVGDYLFWVDGLLDLPRDLRSGAYNALARAFSLRPNAGAPAAARTLAMTRASAAVDALSEAVAALPAHGARPALHRSVVLGFRDKLRRYRHLDAARLPDATLADLLPPRAPVAHALGLQMTRAREALPLRFRMAFAFFLVWLFPRAAWAAGWWPTGADPGLDAPDTGMMPVTPPAHGDTGLFALDGDCGNLCDPCASNCGWFSCEPNCDQVCGTACDGACSDACAG